MQGNADEEEANGEQRLPQTTRAPQAPDVGRVGASSSSDLPSNIEYKDQGRELEEVLSVQALPHSRPLVVGRDLPSNLDYKDQGRELEEVLPVQAWPYSEPLAGSRDFPSNADYKDLGRDWSEFQQQQQQQQVVVATPAVPFSTPSQPVPQLQSQPTETTAQSPNPQSKTSSPSQQSTSPSPRSKRLLWYSLIVVGLILIFSVSLVVALLLSRSNGDDDSSESSRSGTQATPTAAPTMFVTTARDPPVFNITASNSTAVTHRAISATLTTGTIFGAPYHPIYCINLSGLQSRYISGETLFDDYMASDPLHDEAHASQEFWTLQGESTAVLVFFLGQEVTISGFAVWNVDDGEGTFDGTMRFGDALAGPFANDFVFSPAPNTEGQDYPGQVFLLPSPVQASFVQLEMTDCTVVWGNGDYCALGEIAWRVESNE